MGLRQAMLQLKQRETGGSTAQARFDYQACWGAKRILQNYSSGVDFALGFEFHDDIIELDAARQPTRVRFFQIKTKEKGNWSTKSIVKQENGKSILGKLVQTKRAFKEHSEKASLVTNALFTFANEETHFASSQLLETEHKAFLASLQSELKTSDADLLNGVEFVSDSMPLDHCDAVVLSKVTEVIEQEFGSFDCSMAAFCRSILDQCRRRSKKISDVKDFDELLKCKFVTRDNMEKWTQDFVETARSRPSLQSALAMLPMKCHAALRRNWNIYEIQKRDVDSQNVKEARTRISRTISDLKLEDFVALEDVLNSVVAEVKPWNEAHYWLLDDDYLLTIAVYEYLVGSCHGQPVAAIPDAHSKSSDKVQ
jgi:hypothetical protein